MPQSIANYGPAGPAVYEQAQTSHAGSRRGQGRHGTTPVPDLPVRVAVAHRPRRPDRRGLSKAAGGLQVDQGQAVLGHLDADPGNRLCALDFDRRGVGEQIWGRAGSGVVPSSGSMGLQGCLEVAVVGIRAGGNSRPALSLKF